MTDKATETATETTPAKPKRKRGRPAKKKAAAPSILGTRDPSNEEENEARENSVGQPGGNGSQPQGGLKVMDEEAVNDYLKNLLKSQDPGLTGLEATALNSFRGISGEVNKQTQELQQVNAKREELDTSIKRLQGQMDAFVSLLVAAEDDRRADGKTG